MDRTLGEIVCFNISYLGLTPEAPFGWSGSLHCFLKKKLSVLLGVKHVFVFIRSLSVSCLNMAILKKLHILAFYNNLKIRNYSEFATFCTWALQMESLTFDIPKD